VGRSLCAEREYNVGGLENEGGQPFRGVEVNCCVLCFNDSYLTEQITPAGKEGNCDYRGSSGVRTMPAEELSNDFEEPFELYRVVECGVDYYGGMGASDVGDDLPTFFPYPDRGPQRRRSAQRTLVSRSAPLEKRV
jgi:hypothetical protein